MAAKNQLGWFVNQDNCVGCRACEGGCKQENKVAVGVRWRRVVTQEGGKYPKPWRTFTSLACNHCEEPACLKACPVEGAITKRPADGIVIIQQDKCIGCKRCIAACPYGAPQYNSQTKKVEKCHLCYHRIDQGLPPACTITCMGFALYHGRIEEIDKREGAVRRVEGFANPIYTNPSVRFKKPRNVNV